MTKLEKEKLSKITKHFGVRNEAIKLLEETGEFIDLVYEGYHSDITEKLNNDLCEEAADVLVVFNQLVNYFGLSDNQIMEIYQKKIDRTIDRIGQGWYSHHR